MHVDSSVQAGVQRCIDACVRCAQACEECLTSCLREPDVQARVECIRTLRDCADLCWTASRLMSRGSAYAAAICRICADVCEACASQCERFPDRHCQDCARYCRECAEECRRMAAA